MAEDIVRSFVALRGSFAIMCVGVVVALVAVASCSSIIGPGEREMGIIAAEQGTSFLTADSGMSLTGDDNTDLLDLPVLEAPDTVTSGVAFEVIVRTIGPDGCWKADGAQVSRAPSQVEIIPYDRIAGQNCTDAVRRLARTVTVRFDEPAEATIRITGRIVTSREGEWEERVGSIEHRIVVR